MQEDSRQLSVNAERSTVGRLRQGLGGFFSIAGGLAVGVSILLVANAVAGVIFALKTQPKAIRTLDDLNGTHTHDFVELHGRLDYARSLQVEARGETYTLTLARDMSDRLVVYQRGGWVKGEETESVQVFRGRLIGADWAGEWDVDAHRIRLVDQFSRKGIKIPETARVLWVGEVPRWQIWELFVGVIGAVILSVCSARIPRTVSLLFSREPAKE